MEVNIKKSRKRKVKEVKMDACRMFGNSCKKEAYIWIGSWNFLSTEQQWKKRQNLVEDLS